jgi:hypothetical protein
VEAVDVEQADYFINAAALDMKALAGAILRGDTSAGYTLLRMAAGEAGIADKVDNGDGTIDQSKVTDAELLSMTQAHWPTVAALYYSTDGSPI